MKIDIVLWDQHTERKIIASPVSTEGAIALNKYILSIDESGELSQELTPEDFIGCCPISVLPEEFIAHMPKDLIIMFYNRRDNKLTDIRVASKYGLQ